MTRRPPFRCAVVAGCLTALVVPGLAVPATSARPAPRVPASNGRDRAVPIRHVIEVMLENHTEDNLFASFPGARGVPAGTVLADPGVAGGKASPSVAPPNEGEVQGGLNNSRGAELAMMDRRNGRYQMDGYARFPGEGRSALTTFSPAVDPNLQFLARHFELADRNFQPVVAPTLPNVLFALAATSHGALTNDVPDTGSWWTIFDELAAAHRSWRIYSGVPTWVYQNTVWTHLLPPGGESDLVGASRFFADLRQGRLPDFSFVRPGVGYSEEPPEDVGEGDAWLGEVVAALAGSRYWGSTALFVTYDEGGGFYDHVPPPVVPRSDGEGTRTPLVIVSPYARRGVFDASTTNVSILSFVQHLWGLAPLNSLNAAQNNLLRAFDFQRKPLPPPHLPLAPPATIGFSGTGELADVPAGAPGRVLMVRLQVNTPGLAPDPAVSGVVRLTTIPPAGVASPTGVPALVRLFGGRATLTLRIAHPGYYRVHAQGPDGSVGWLTLDVGVGPNTP